MGIFRPSNFPSWVPLGLRSVGSHLLYPYSIHKRRPADFIQIFWITEGEGFIVMKNKAYRFKKGWIGIYMPGEPHHLYTKRSNMECKYITVDGIASRLIIEGLGLNTRQPFRVDPFPESLLKDLSKRIEKIERKNEYITSLRLYEFFIYLANHSCVKNIKQEKHILHENTIKKAIEIIHNNIENSLFGINQLASLLKVHRTALSKTFKLATGMSPAEYLQSLRLQKILSLLTSNTISIKEIAKQSGFDNPNYMSKFFRKKMGLSPTEFRDRYSEFSFKENSLTQR